MLEPKPSDLTMIRLKIYKRILEGRTSCCCNNIGWIVVRGERL